MFVIAKLLNVLTQPLAWVVALLLLGLLLQRHWRRAGLGLLWTALFVLLLQGWEPLPDAVLRQLEAQHPAPVQLDLSQYAGVIVLGGSTESSYVWEGHDQPALNSAAERLTAALPLLRREPRLLLLYTGGEGEWLADGPSEAERARRFYAQQGVPSERLLLESRSRNTHENALFSATLPGVDRTRPWLLITSAWHMPRALGTFKQVGWNVTPWPPDYRTGLATPWHQYSLSQGAAKWQLALHELVGWAAYRLSGRL
jgi:uncharacterized SAM-binding protein YcdF (DUF218 family)